MNKNKNIEVCDDAASIEVLAKKYILNESYYKAELAYHRVLGLQDSAIDLIVSKSQVLRNQRRLGEAIKTLEDSISLGICNSKTLHVLSSYYRDNREWSKSELYIWRVIASDKRYASLVGFSVYAADILRKRGFLYTAYSILFTSSLVLKGEKKKAPLNLASALVELEHQISSGYSFEVSSKYYDAVYEGSEKYASASASSIYVPVWEKVLEVLMSKGALSVVDIGCGPGQFAEYFLNNSSDISYSGFDYSSIAISLAKKRVPSFRFILGDAFDFSFLCEVGGVFYLLLEVLEHIEDDVKLIESFPIGSNVIFTVPNFDSFGHVRFFLNKEEVYDRYSSFFSFLDVENVRVKGYSAIYLAYGRR